jgi:glycosyltransferase involved in cell wall biosynthesis
LERLGTEFALSSVRATHGHGVRPDFWAKEVVPGTRKSIRRKLAPIFGSPNMSLDCPTVSICVPVYNGEPYLREAIDSILAQTFEDFELIISDNASTDHTPEICRETLARDRRVRYSRSEVNRGLAANHNRAFELAKGRYVVWSGHDDLMDKEYIARCVEALDQDPEAVLCFAGTNYIDDRGSLIKRVPLENSGAFEKPGERLFTILLDNMCDPILGMMRTEVLKQTRLHGGFADSDRVLLVEMGLRGRFKLIPEYLFSRRMHSQQLTSNCRNLRERTLIFDPTKKGRVFFPMMLEVMALFSAIRRAKLPFREQLRCYRYLLRWLWIHHNWLRDDLCEGMLTTIKLYLRKTMSPTRA